MKHKQKFRKTTQENLADYYHKLSKKDLKWLQDAELTLYDNYDYKEKKLPIELRRELVREDHKRTRDLFTQQKARSQLSQIDAESENEALYFTDEIFEELKLKGVEQVFESITSNTLDDVWAASDDEELKSVLKRYLYRAFHLIALEKRLRKGEYKTGLRGNRAKKKVEKSKVK